MTSIITLPFYIIPLLIALKKDSFSPRLVFFIYSLLGCWLLSFLIDINLYTSSLIIASWVIDKEDLPFYTFAIANFLIFITSELKKNNIVNPNFYRLKMELSTIINILLISITIQYAITIVAYGSIAEWITASFRRSVHENYLLNMIYPLTVFTNTLFIVTFAIKNHKNLKSTKFNIIFILQLTFLLLSGGRSILLLTIISLLVIKYNVINKRTMIKISLILISLIIISGIMISERYNIQNAEIRVDSNIKSLIIASYTGLPYIDHIALSQNYARHNGYNYGKFYLDSLLIFIPRSIWNEKPIQLSREIRKFYWGDSSGGIPPGLFGEAIIALGTFGLFLISIIYGISLSICNYVFDPERNEVIGRLRLAIFSTLIGFILIRGGIDIGLYRVGMIIFFYIIIEKVLFKKISNV